MVRVLDRQRLEPELLAQVGIGEGVQRPAILRQQAQRGVAGRGELRRRPDPVGLQRDQAAGDHELLPVGWTPGLGCFVGSVAQGNCHLAELNNH